MIFRINRSIPKKQLSKGISPVPSTDLIPQYRNDSQLLGALRTFVTEGLDSHTKASLFGQFAGVEIFCLSRICQREWNEIDKSYSGDMVFVLALFSRESTIEYSISEYLSDEGYDIDGYCGIVADIRNDIAAYLESPQS